MTRANGFVVLKQKLSQHPVLSPRLPLPVSHFCKISLPMQFREGLACNNVGVTRRVRHGECARKKFHVIFRVCVIKEHV